MLSPRAIIGAVPCLYGLHAVGVGFIAEREEQLLEGAPGAADEIVKQTGKRAIPQFVIDGEWVQPYRPGEGFLYEEMAERLGVKES